MANNSVYNIHVALEYGGFNVSREVSNAPEVGALGAVIVTVFANQRSGPDALFGIEALILHILPYVANPALINRVAETAGDAGNLIGVLESCKLYHTSIALSNMSKSPDISHAPLFLPEKACIRFASFINLRRPGVLIALLNRLPDLSPYLEIREHLHNAAVRRKGQALQYAGNKRAQPDNISNCILSCLLFIPFALFYT